MKESNTNKPNQMFLFTVDLLSIVDLRAAIYVQSHGG
jgi:hypothetical protein